MTCQREAGSAGNTGGNRRPAPSPATLEPGPSGGASHSEKPDADAMADGAVMDVLYKVTRPPSPLTPL